jgi:hypothetical protein
MIEDEIRPSRWYYGLAGLVFVAGWVLFAVVLFKNLSGLADKLQQVVVPGNVELTLSKPGKYTIYYEYRSVVGTRIFSSEESLPGLQCRLVSRTTGSSIPLSRVTGSSSYTLGGRSGVGVLDFTIDKAGAYELSAGYPEGREGPEVVLAIGQGFTGGILTAVFGGLATVFGSMGAAVAIAVITFLKRMRAERALKRPDAQYRPIE